MTGSRTRRYRAGALAAALVTLTDAAAQAQSGDPHAGHQHGAPASRPRADDMAGMDMGSMKGMDMGATHPPPPRASVGLPTSVSTADGVTLRASATGVALAFDRPVVVASIALANAVGQRFPFNATLSDTPVGGVGASLIRLAPGRYTLTWSVIDVHGELRSSTRTFTVS